MISTTFKRRMLSVLLTTSSLCLPAAARAQIVAADGATTVYTNPNSVPVVDIAAPNAGGVSHNRFTNYNVDQRGMVLNNGPTDVVARQSQLAGQVLANTNIGKTAATVILNEVVSTNRSTLNGFTEVLGSAADVIVANPYGITCGGCGFLNAPNVILTTGAPQMDADGKVTGFAVSGGDLVVTGAGLNATGQDYLALLARRVIVQGAVNGKAVDVVGGAHDFDLATRTAKARAGTGVVPLYAIDSSVLGGMYTNRIRLIVTEAGAGVRMAGDMAATGGDFTLDAAGQVELSGKLSASGAIRATTSGSRLALAGASTTAGEGFALDATAGTVALTGGAINAGRDIAVTAASLSDQAAASGATRTAKSIALNVAGAGTVTGTTWTSDGALTADLASLAVSGGTLSGASVVLTTAGDLGLAKTALRAGGAATLTAGGTLSVDGTVQALAGDIALSGVAAVNQSGALSADKGAVTIASRGSFAAAGTVQAAKDLSATAGSMDVGGTLLAGGTLTATTAGVLANRGTIQSTGRMTLAAATLRNAGTVTGTQGLAVASASVANIADGVIQSTGAITLTGLGELTNDGRVVAGANLSIAGTTARPVAVMNGQTGVLQAASALTLTGGGALVQSGKMLAADVSLSAGSVRNTGVMQGDNTLAIAATAEIGNSGLLLGKASATLAAGTTLTNAATVQGDRLTLTAATVDNTGAVKGGATLLVTAGTATNSGALTADTVSMAVGALTNAASGTIKAATGDLTLAGVRSIANAGLLLAGRNLTTGAAEGTRTALTNSATGAFQAGRALALNGVGTLTQSGGLLATTITLDATDAANTGLIQSSGALDARVAGTLANSGTIAGTGATSLAAATFTNASAVSGGSLTVTATDAVGNSGTLYTDGALALTTAKLANEKAGGIQGSAGTTLTAATLTNAGQIVTAAVASANGAVTAGTLTNTGSIVSAGGLGLTLSGSLDNSGTLLAQSALSIDAAAARAVTIANRTDAGAIKAGTALSFGGAGTLAVTVAGGLVSGGTITGTLSALTNAGTVQAVRTLSLTTTGQVGNSGTLIAGETLTLGGGGLSNSGLVQTDGTGALRFATLTNGARIYGMGTALALEAGQMTNAAGATIYSAGALALTGGTAIDNAGSLLADAAMTVGASGTNPLAFTNRATGEAKASGAITVSAANGGVALTQDGMLAAASLTLALDRYQGAGKTTSRGAIDLFAAKGASSAGLLYAAGILTLGGTGFTNTGEVSAAGSTIVVGDFANRGLFAAARDATGATILAAQTFGNSGTFQAEGDIALRLAGSLTNTGDMIAAGALDVLATAGALSIGNGADTAVAADRAALLQAGHGLTIKAGAAGATATLASNAGTILGSTVTLDLQSLASAGTIQGDTAVQVTAAGAVGNAGVVLSSGTLALTADSIANTGGIQGATGTTIRAKGALNNAGGTIVLAAGATAGGTIAAGSVTSSGTIQSAGAAEIDSARLTNTGLIYTGGALVLDGLNGGASTIANGGKGIIQSLGTLRVGAASGASKSTLSLTGGVVYGNGVTFNLDRLTNSGGWIQSDGALAFTGSTFQNSGTTLVLGRSAITATALTNSGTFDSTGAATIIADMVQNSGVLALSRVDAAGRITARMLTNDKGATLYGKGDVALRVDERIGNAGSIISEGRLSAYALAGNGLRIENEGEVASIYAARDIELGTDGRMVDLQTGTGSELVSAGDLTIHGDELKTKGLLQAGQTLKLSATTVDNDATIVATKRLTADVTKDFRNSGTVQAGSSRISADKIDNGSTGTLNLATDSGGLAELVANTIGNSGWVQSLGNLQLTATRSVDNNGRLLASQAIDIMRRGNDPFELKLRGNSVVQSDSLRVNLPSLSVTNGGQILVGRLDLTLASLTNAGVLQALGDAQLQFGTGAFANNGTVYAGGTTKLTAGSLATAAGTRFQAVGGLAATISGIVDNKGTIFAGQDADAATKTPEVKGTLTLTAASISNAGTLASIGKQELRVSGRLSNADDAKIYGKGDVTIGGTSSTAATLANAAKGTIYAGGMLDITSTADRRIAFGENVSQGLVYGGDLNIALAELNNTGVIQSDRVATLTIEGDFANLTGGLLFLGANTDGPSGGLLSAKSVSNSGDIQSNGSLLISSRTDFYNTFKGRMIAGKALTLTGLAGAASPSTLTNYGLLQAGGALTISSAGGERFGKVTLNGANAKIVAGLASLKVGELWLGAGNSVSTFGTATIDANTLTMTSATSRILGGAGKSSLTVASDLDVKGAIYADGDMTVRAPSITNRGDGALAAGGTLDIAATGVAPLDQNGNPTYATGFVSNAGTIFAGNLKLVAGTFFLNSTSAETGIGTVDTTGDAEITAPEFENNSRFQIGRNLTITAKTIKNQVTGGDTRIDTEKASGFKDEYSDADHDPRVGADGETKEQKDMELDGPEMNYSVNELANSKITAAYKPTPDTTTWQSTKTRGTLEITGTTSWNYHATFETRVYWSDEAPTTRPQMLANGAIVFKDFTDFRNLGGTISAQAITFDARPKNMADDKPADATILNDALDTKIVYWIAEWNHYRLCTTKYTGCDWTYFRSYNKWHDPAKPPIYNSVGATISAASIQVLNNAKLTQAGTTTYEDNKAPDKIGIDKTTEDTVKPASAASGSSIVAAPPSTTVTPGNATKDPLKDVTPTTQTLGTSSPINAAAPGAGLNTTAARSLKDISTVESAVVGVRVDIAAVTNAGTVAQRLNDLADIGPRGQIIIDREAQNAASLPQSPLQAVTASDGRTSLVFDGVTVALPTSPNARYVATVSPTASYLIESNPIYGIGSSAFSSDFIAQRLGLNPDILQRRLGDAAYETFLVTQQVVAQTGAASIVRAETTDQQYARLMVQALAQASDMELVYGRALTGAQIANLRQDMVWMVLTEVKGQKVLAPVVYLSARTKALFDPKNATIAGDVVDMSLSSLTNNGGNITGSTSLNLKSTGDIINRSGTITGGNVSVISTEGSIINQTMTMQAGVAQVGRTATIAATKALTLGAGKDITVRGGTVSAGTDASLKAGRDITFTTIDKKSSSSSKDGDTSSVTTSIEQVGSTLNVGGNLNLNSGRDTTFKASEANIAGNANVTTGGNFNILAGQNSTETNSSSERSGAGVGGGVYGTEKTTTNTFTGRNVASGFNVGGDANITATGDMTVQGSNVNIGGNANVTATSVNILQGNDVDRSTTTTDTVTYLRTSGSGEGTKGADASADANSSKFVHKAGAQAGAKTGISGKGDLEVMNKTTQTTTEEHSRAVGSTFNVGGNATITATKDVTLQGSSLDANGDVDINAERINLLAAENRDVVTTTTNSNSVGLMAESANEAEAKAKAEASQTFTLQAKASAGVKAESDNTVDLYRNQQSQTTQTDITHTGSSIKSGGSTSLTATKTLNVQGSSIEATKDVNLNAKNMTFGAVDDVHETTTTTQQTGVGLYGNVNGEAKAGGNANLIGGKVGAGAAAEASTGVQVKHVTTSETVGSTTAVTSSIKSGGDITRTATNKITDVGTAIEAGGDFKQTATEWDSKAARDTTYSTTTEQTDKARLGAYVDADAGAQRAVGAAGEKKGADTGASLGGKVSYSHEDTKETENTGTARVSTIKTGGNFSSTTTGKTSLEGTSVDAGKDATLTAGSLDYTAARNTEDSTNTANKGEGSAKVGIDAAKAVKGSGEFSYEGEQGKANSSQAVAGELKSGGNLTVTTTQGDVNFEGTKLNSTGDTLVGSAGSVNMTAARDTSSKTTNKEDAKISGAATGEAAGVEVEGAFSHEKETTDKAQVGSVTSGGTLTIKAANDVTLEGTRTDSLGKTTLDAGGNVNLTVAKDSSTKESYGAEISASAERSKKPEGDETPTDKSKDTGDGPRIGTRTESGTPSKTGDAATPSTTPSKPGDASTPSTPKKPGDAGTPSTTPTKPGDAGTPSTTPTKTGDAANGQATTPTWTSASPSGTAPVTTTPRSGDAGNGPATTPASPTSTTPVTAPPKTGDAANGQTNAPTWTPASPTTNTPSKAPTSPTSTTPATPTSSTPATNTGDAANNGGTQGNAPANAGWTKTTPTETKPTTTDANGGSKPGDAPKPPEGTTPTTPKSTTDGKGSGTPKGPEWENSGGANGGANYSSSSDTTTTGPTITSGDGVSLNAGGDITKENTVILGPTETTAGGETKDVTIDDTHTKNQYGGTIGGQSTKANSGAGTTDTVK